MPKFQIKNRFSLEVIFESEAVSFSATVRAAFEARANLSEANLSKANLSKANLSKANLSEANLSWANLSKANLSWANLSEANLSWANLSEANLSWANLSEADLSEARLPAPTSLLLANWASVSAELCADLMIYDSTCHPDPTAFDRWAAGGSCPYEGVPVQRAANFREARELWNKGKVCRPFDLMVRLFAEKGIKFGK